MTRSSRSLGLGRVEVVLRDLLGELVELVPASGTGALTSDARSSWNWYWFDARDAAAAAALPPGYWMLVMLAVLLARWPGFGPVTLLPLMMYIHEPSALNVMSCGS